MGAVQIPVQDTLSVLLQHLFGTDTGTPVSIAFEQIVWQIRMPRIILGFLAGSGLALCGCVMQAVVQNPMADPYILGVSAGATLGATGFALSGAGRDFRLLGLCRSWQCLLSRIGPLLGGWQDHLSQADSLWHDRQCATDRIFQLYHCNSR